MNENNMNFSMIVEQRVLTAGLSYMDAIIDLCETHEIEFEVLKSALNKNIKEKIELEAKKLNMMLDNDVPRSLF